ncbi:hypothetical protein [Arthrobacter bambusae]|uniref:Cell division protein FtsK n=1 Tax=Arthrobacter bambusae TaxID=1338426 RepID=A0AAW8DHF7_9MICC|nr:hypothetical protein [Arthrobacter bambusae]MDP9904689.1 hypothetical protein [Arthrobacter bambusae]MDQ0129505.1 hypothetical protein [Arthrobacter bambusae]MDQ0180882.1 hypothetical protein [Arthrobacter bambusae]
MSDDPSRIPIHPPTCADAWDAHQPPRGRVVEFFRQVGIGYAVLIPVLFLFLAVGGADGDTTVFGLLLGLVFVPGLTMMVTAVIGLPIRLIPGIRRWWIRYGGIAIFGIFLSFGMIVYGCATGHEASYTDQELSLPVTGYEPDGTYVLPGWFALAFFATHTWIPPRWKKKQRATLPGRLRRE